MDIQEKIKYDEKHYIYQQTKFVYEDEGTGFKIVSPLTEEAAKWWGHDTKWSISSERYNSFQEYSKQSPLLILLMPDKKKILAWKGEEFNLFLNANNDDDVGLDYIEKNWEKLEPVVKYLNSLEYIPYEYRTEELCKSVIQQNADSFQHVPEHLITKEFCESIVEINIECYGLIPEHLKTENICKFVVKKNGNSLHFIQKDMRTEEICRLAIEQNGNALQFVPEEMITEELCKMAINQKIDSIDFVPEIFLTEELCKMAVKKHWWILQSIPQKYLTEEICKIAVQQNKDAMDYVPECLQEKMKCHILYGAIKVKFPNSKYEDVFLEIQSLFLK